jgi:uncharacterized protein YecT (DUF1311 family)
MASKFLSALLFANVVVCLAAMSAVGVAAGNRIDKPAPAGTQTEKRDGYCEGAITQGSLNQCAAGPARNAQQLLDSLLNELNGVLDSSERTQLQQVQLQWTNYRAAHCAWQAKFFEGGSIEPTIFASCMEDLTWKRLDDLKLNLCEGNGMTGPCPKSQRYDKRP